jgi:hypothetical protein
MKMIDNVDTNTFADQKARDWLIGVLREQTVTVTFTKQDGTERVMNCTLYEGDIPVDQAPKNSGRTKPTESLAVFDIEAKGWRSFRWDSIKEVKFTLGQAK